VRASVEQVFLKRRGPVTEALLVLERETGARERVTLTLPSDELAEAVRLLARHLARTPDVDGVDRCRLRVDRGGTVVDDHVLRAALRAAFVRERRGDEAL
jgi:hypothetical protein